jgi:hypothetical protein
MLARRSFSEGVKPGMPADAEIEPDKSKQQDGQDRMDKNRQVPQKQK